MSQSTQFTTLEIRILKQEDAGYPIELTLDGSQEFQGGYLSPEILPWVPGVSPTEDGTRLFDALLSDDQLKQAWAEIRGRNAQRQIRLRIDKTAPELHSIPWELLHDTSPGQPAQTLAADATTPFSRYLAGQWPPGQPISKRPLKLLVAIASPDNLDEFGLANIDIDLETQIIQDALSNIGLDQLKSTFVEQPVTLSALETQLKKGFHILHLIAHGRFNQKKEVAALCLADEDNEVRWIKEVEFCNMLNRQHQKPQLIFLATCQSASRSPADAFRGFAPQIITSGIPAVLAMQDLIPITTAQEFAGVFYHQLLQHGQVDLAGNEARSAVITANLSGSSIPVLFSRLPDNRLFDFSDLAPAKPRLPFEPNTVTVYAGPFLMGSQAGDDVPDEETPQHEINLPEYQISKYPITNAQYAEFIRRNPQQSVPKKAGWFLREPPAGKLDHPVTGINWFDAHAYCEWLCQETNRLYRLPTEAEWEKAASWSDTGKNKFPWGDKFDAAKANTRESELDDTSPVGAYSPQGDSPAGCADMAGNVHEWTSTLWGSDLKQNDFPYPYQPDDGREDTNTDERRHRVFRVYRGGAFRDRQSKVTATARNASDPDSKIRWRGFRVVLEV